jgi:hypothetical protein
MLISYQNDQHVKTIIFVKLDHFWAALPDKNLFFSQIRVCRKTACWVGGCKHPAGSRLESPLGLVQFSSKPCWGLSWGIVRAFELGIFSLWQSLFIQKQFWQMAHASLKTLEMCVQTSVTLPPLSPIWIHYISKSLVEVNQAKKSLVR